jgi:hypothetical protein
MQSVRREDSSFFLEFKCSAGGAPIRWQFTLGSFFENYTTFLGHFICALKVMHLFRPKMDLAIFWAIFSQTQLGPIFCTFFPRNFLEKLFFKTFSAENCNFSQHFLGVYFLWNFPRNFPRKKCTKNWPLVALMFGSRVVSVALVLFYAVSGSLRPV